MRTERIGDATLHLGDCLYVMLTMPDDSVDSIVTDPPYGLSFMGKKWDYEIPSVDIWKECLRVLKPGGHLLSFAGTQTQHRMCCNIEDAGFEIRDMIAWVYGSGFPKSLDVGKAIDKAAGVDREVVSTQKSNWRPSKRTMKGHAERWEAYQKWAEIQNITIPATDAAKQWDGWGSALKPAMELITVARKPLEGTIAENVLKYGTGGLNIDGCRIGTEKIQTNRYIAKGDMTSFRGSQAGNAYVSNVHKGRWPANLIHDGSDEVVRLFPETEKSGKGSGLTATSARSWKNSSLAGINRIGHNDAGSAARFFYTAKANKADRSQDNKHPTVKPTDLMCYLLQLVTPPGGIALDPFMGSGSTGKAAIQEGFAFIGIEKELKSFDIAHKRIKQAQRKPHPDKDGTLTMGAFDL